MFLTRLDARGAAPLRHLATPATRGFVSKEEIKHLVAEGREQGVIDQTEMEIIHSVFEFTETPVQKVMVPRPKIFALDVDTPPGEVERHDRGERLLAHPGLRGLGRQHGRASSS